MGEFEREVIGFMGEIRQYMKSQPGRCASHSTGIKCVEERITTVERSIDFSEKGKSLGDRVKTIEDNQGNVKWLDRWLLYAWSAIIMIGGWIFVHSSKVDHETAKNAVDVIRKIKGGG